MEIFQKLKQQRAKLEDTWQDINKYVKPQKNYFLNTTKHNSTEEIFDSSAMLASDHLASFIWSLVNSSSLPWFSFLLKDENQNKENPLWNEAVNKVVADSLLSPEVGFYYKSFELYSDLVNYGTAVFYSGYNLENNLALFKTIGLKDCYVLRSELDQTAGVIRKINLSQSEFKSFFSKGNAIQSDDANVDILHIVIKSSLIKDQKNMAIGKDWSSFYVLEKNGKILNHDGYKVCPYTVLRWASSCQSVYGESPAMLALPDIKTLNEIAKSIIVATQRQSDPPILVANESSIKGAKIAPGSLIKGGISSVTGETLIKALNLDIKNENILKFYEQKKQMVLDVFYNSTISHNLQTKKMSATEVDINKEQQLSVLGPKVSRIQSEFLYPLLKRKYEILKDLGKIPALKNGDIPSVNCINVSFKGLFSKYQKVNSIKNLNSALSSLLLVEDLNPSEIENLDTKAVAQKIAKTYGIQSFTN